MDVDATGPDGSRLVRYKATRYLPHLQRAHVHFLYDAFGRATPPERFVSDFESHVYYPREIELLFLLAGFEIEARWGSYELGPFDETSKEMIVVGRRLE
jgi:hypothetical protein